MMKVLCILMIVVAFAQAGSAFKEVNASVNDVKDAIVEHLTTLQKLNPQMSTLKFTVEEQIAKDGSGERCFYIMREPISCNLGSVANYINDSDLGGYVIEYGLNKTTELRITQRYLGIFPSTKNPGMAVITCNSRIEMKTQKGWVNLKDNSGIDEAELAHYAENWEKHSPSFSNYKAITEKVEKTGISISSSHQQRMLQQMCKLNIEFYHIRMNLKKTVILKLPILFRRNTSLSVKKE
jgi:hypothetical protein